MSLLQHPEQLWWVTGVCKAQASVVLLVSHGLQDSPGHQSPFSSSCLPPCTVVILALALRSVQTQGVLTSVCTAGQVSSLPSSLSPEPVTTPSSLREWLSSTFLTSALVWGMKLR